MTPASNPSSFTNASELLTRFYERKTQFILPFRDSQNQQEPESTFDFQTKWTIIELTINTSTNSALHLSKINFKVRRVEEGNRSFCNPSLAEMFFPDNPKLNDYLDRHKPIKKTRRILFQTACENFNVTMPNGGENLFSNQVFTAIKTHNQGNEILNNSSASSSSSTSSSSSSNNSSLTVKTSSIPIQPQKENKVPTAFSIVKQAYDSKIPFYYFDPNSNASDCEHLWDFVVEPYEGQGGVMVSRKTRNSGKQVSSAALSLYRTFFQETPDGNALNALIGEIPRALNQKFDLLRGFYKKEGLDFPWESPAQFKVNDAFNKLKKHLEEKKKIQGGNSSKPTEKRPRIPVHTDSISPAAPSSFGINAPDSFSSIHSKRQKTPENPQEVHISSPPINAQLLSNESTGQDPLPQLPQLSLPNESTDQGSLPQLPQLSLPNESTGQDPLPQIPQLSLPNESTDQGSLPQLPQLNLLNELTDQGSLPQLPQLSLPNESTGQDPLPQLPQLSLPNESTDQGSLPQLPQLSLADIRVLTPKPFVFSPFNRPCDDETN